MYYRNYTTVGQRNQVIFQIEWTHDREFLKTTVRVIKNMVNPILVGLTFDDFPGGGDEGLTMPP